MEVREKNFPDHRVGRAQGVEEMGINMKDMLGNLFQGRTKHRKMRVDEAMEYLMQEEEERLIDMDQVARAAIERVESSGIIFLDEIDKIAGRESGHGPDVSREGVQRDILPIVEGTTVNTRYGMVRTDHILFIAAGAFHVSKPSDLIPELQGRFPIRVELESLTVEDFKRILTEPKNALDQTVSGDDGDGRRRDRFHRRRHRFDRELCGAGESSKPKTSARAACTPSWRGCWKRSVLKDPIWNRRTTRSTPLT